MFGMSKKFGMMGGFAGMQMETIAAISTAQGQGGIGIVRVSGESAISIVDRLFVAVSGRTLAETPGYAARFGKKIGRASCRERV